MEEIRKRKERESLMMDSNCISVTRRERRRRIGVSTAAAAITLALCCYPGRTASAFTSLIPNTPSLLSISQRLHRHRNSNQQLFLLKDENELAVGSSLPTALNAGSPQRSSTRKTKTKTAISDSENDTNKSRNSKRRKDNKNQNEKSTDDIEMITPKLNSVGDSLNDPEDTMTTEERKKREAKLMEILADRFVFPTDGQDPFNPVAKRRNGRPQAVVGAMKKDTYADLIKHDQAFANGEITIEEFLKLGQREDRVIFSDSNLFPSTLKLQDNLEVPITKESAAPDSSASKTTNDKEGDSPTLELLDAMTATPKRKRRSRTKTPTKPTKGSSSSEPSLNLYPVKGKTSSKTNVASKRKSSKKKASRKTEVRAKASVKKTRSRRKKDLPPARSREEGYDLGSNYFPHGLQRYYRTELLTAKEEYKLATRVHFLVQCEQVHKGLALKHDRLPTFVEWANACGFVKPDEDFVERKEYEDIRPPDAKAMFEKVNPNFFVGNGRASELGVGRGNGRKKAPPPTHLEHYFDDTENRFRPVGTPQIPELLLNVGTPTQFIETLKQCRKAKQRMIASNMRLVLSIARKHGGYGVSIQDLVQEGGMGLNKAADRFHPRRGFKFSTYASWWIQQSVFVSLAYHSRTIRLPAHIHNLLNRLRKVKSKLACELGRPPTSAEMAEALDMSVEKYFKLMRVSRECISTELPRYRKDNPGSTQNAESEESLGEAINNEMPSPTDKEGEVDETQVDRSLLRSHIFDIIAKMDEDKKRVLCARYGLEDGYPRSVSAVAAQMKKSKAWVHSLEFKALRELRRPWYEAALKEFRESNFDARVKKANARDENEAIAK